MNESNRRNHGRIPAYLPVRISTIDPETDPWTGKPFFRSSREWSTNISRGGLFVRTQEPILPGQRVLLELSLPGGQGIEAVGRVAWARRVMRVGADEDDAGIGLQFVGTTAEEMNALETWVREHEHPAAA
jgi:uncharacterized protein (TIGR02266 family)